MKGSRYGFFKIHSCISPNAKIEMAEKIRKARIQIETTKGIGEIKDLLDIFDHLIDELPECKEN